MSAQVAADLRAEADRLAVVGQAHDLAAARLLQVGLTEHAAGAMAKADRFIQRAFDLDAAADAADRAVSDQ